MPQIVFYWTVLLLQLAPCEFNQSIKHFYPFISPAICYFLKEEMMTDKEISVSLSLPTLSVSHPLYLSQFLIPSISFSWYLVCKLSIGLQRDFQSEGAGLLFSLKVGVKPTDFDNTYFYFSQIKGQSSEMKSFIKRVNFVLLKTRNTYVR